MINLVQEVSAATVQLREAGYSREADLLNTLYALLDFETEERARVQAAFNMLEAKIAGWQTMSNFGVRT